MHMEKLEEVAEALNLLMRKKLDYVSPDKHTCAAGFYSEAVTLDALRKAYSLSHDRDA